MRIATFILESFGKVASRSPSFEVRAAVLRPQLERLKADILCLQEIDAPKSAGLRRPRDLERLLVDTSFANHRLITSTGPSGAGPADIHNLAVVTRLQLLEAHELIAYGRIERAPESLHAPVLASFEIS